MSDVRIDVPTPDGRSLEVLLAGPEDGFPLVFHHGTPQGAVPNPILDRPAAERGLRVIAYSRPGYGASTPRSDGVTTATVADDAGDVAAILDHLGYDDFITLGWSGGGPRALACAALLPERCRAAACCVGIAPRADFDGDIRDGMGQENVDEYTAAFAGPAALEAHLAGESDLFAVTADEIAASLGTLASPVDRAALTGEMAEIMAASFRRAGAQGIVGWRDDDLTHVRPWGFDVGDIAVPVAVWQGREDQMVPFAHAEWLIAHVGGARAHRVEGEGHLSLFGRIHLILDDLLDLAGPNGG
jgi:pimeloyl-ACP methyl ester carboxylesterase